MKYLTILITCLAYNCYPADFITSQGVAVFIESREWVDVEANESAWGIDFRDPDYEMIDAALEFLALEGPAVLGVDEELIRQVYRYSYLYIYPEKFACGKWGLCAGCNWHDGRKGIKWYGDVWVSPFFHEFMHDFSDVPHGIAGDPDSPHHPWWDNQYVLNEMYRDTLGNLREN